MDKRGQSALEYLMTYGWALIVIAIVIGVLIYVTSTGTGGVTCQSTSTGLILKEWAVAPGANGAGITLQNDTGGAITTITGEGHGDFANDSIDIDDPVATPAAGAAKNAQFTVTKIDVNATGTSFNNGEILVEYTTSGGLSAKANIVCAGTI
tara:strand:+ start:139 stop:594 length:456 start_codon:yes stop_codon:yes gene_type:complete